MHSAVIFKRLEIHRMHHKHIVRIIIYYKPQNLNIIKNYFTLHFLIHDILAKYVTMYNANAIDSFNVSVALIANWREMDIAAHRSMSTHYSVCQIMSNHTKFITAIPHTCFPLTLLFKVCVLRTLFLSDTGYCVVTSHNAPAA